MIIDVSTYQGAIDWPRARAAGVTRAIIRGPLGAAWVDDRFRTNWSAAAAAGIPERGIYCDLIKEQPGAAQALNIFHQTGGDFGTEPVALDVELTKAEKAAIAAGQPWDKAAYTAMLKAVVFALLPAVRVAIYTSKIEWEAMTTQPAWALDLVHWLAHYNDHISAPDVPAGWSWDLWQYGQAPVDGIAEPVDVNRERVTTMPVPTLVIPTGCLIGGHTQGNSDIIPIYADLAAAGAVPNILISDEDGGKALDAQRLGVRTRISRLERPKSESDYEYGGAGRLSWTPQQVQYFVTSSVDMPYKRLGVAEIQAMTHVQAGYNEWDSQTVEEWLRSFDIFEMVLDQAAQRSPQDKAALMGISLAEAQTLPPIRYVLPIFNYGTPKAWEMYQAIAAHSIWPKMVAGGHILGVHEGIGFNQPFDYLADGGPNDQGVRGHNTLDGAPYLPGAGLVNFRLDYLLSLLWQRGIKINWAVLEWYDGREPRDFDIEARVDNLIHHDQLLARTGGPWRAYCLGYCTFELTNDLKSPWRPQDFTLIWRHPRWRAYFISQAGRNNGGTRMPDISQADFDTLEANSRTRLALDQADQAIYGHYQAAHVWKAGDVALANTNPLITYAAPGGAVKDKRPPTPGPMITYDLNVVAVSADQLWLEVAPGLWVKTADVKLKA